MLPTWLIQILFVVAIAGGGYWYFTVTQAKIARLNKEVTTLEITNERNQLAIKALTSTIESNNKAIQDLMNQIQVGERYKKELIEIFQEHDLQRLSIAKPGLIENRINDGTRKVFDDIESLTTPDGM